MNFLDLCRELVAQFGIAGGSGPDNVIGQTGELANVVRWVRDASLDIDNRWEDWRYHWCRYTGQVKQGLYVPTAPTQPGVTVRYWRNGTMMQRAVNAGTWTPVTYVPYQQWEQRFSPALEVAGAPQFYTTLPDDSIEFNRPANADYNLKGEFYRRPKVLTANTDTPLMPAEYHRIILVRALKYYADREDAPELIQAAIAEYPDILEKLESNQLDAFRVRRVSSEPSQLAGLEYADQIG